MKRVIRGAIFYANLDPIVGSEQSGQRLVVVVQNDIGNKYSPTTIVVPITSKSSKYRKQPTHIYVKQFSEIRPNSIILAEQIRVIDKIRLKGYLDILEEETMKEVDKAIKIALCLK